METMETAENCLEIKIMRRVRTIYWCRQITKPGMLKAWALFGFSGLLMLQVSFFSIWANSPSMTHPGEFSRFLVFAVRETEWIVKLGLVGLSLISLSFLIPALQSIHVRPLLSRHFRLPFLRV
jgi:hypothetical protein